MTQVVGFKPNHLCMQSPRRKDRMFPASCCTACAFLCSFECWLSLAKLQAHACMAIKKAFVKAKEVPDDADFHTHCSVPRTGKSRDLAPKCESVAFLGVIQKPY